MQGTWVRPLFWEDSTCHSATNPSCHSDWRPSSWTCALQQGMPVPSGDSRCLNLPLEENSVLVRRLVLPKKLWSVSIFNFINKKFGELCFLSCHVNSYRRVSICLLGLQNLKCLLILYRKEFFDSCPRILPYLPQVKLSSKVWLLEKTVGTSLSSHTTELHLHEVSKAVKFIEAES